MKSLFAALLIIAHAGQASAMFIQPDWFDPTQPGVGTNRYAYSFNDPINNHDPGGNACLPCAIPPAIEALKWGGALIIGAIGLGVATNQNPNIDVPASNRTVTNRRNGGPQLDPTPPDPVGPTLAALAAAGYAVSRDHLSELGTGQTIDAMGPFPSDHFSMRSVSRSLDRHLRKSVDRVSVDGTGLTSAQRDALRENINNRPREERDCIDTIGLD